MYKNHFYGDETRWFIGRVVDNNDPLYLGRVKVRIHGIHTGSTQDIPEYALPWAQVVLPVTEEGTTGYGSNPAILPTAQVFGIFLDGKDSQLPLVIGSIPKIESDVEEGPNTYSPSMTDDNLPGTTNEEKTFRYLISADQHAYTPVQACGIIGNLLHESGLNPLAVSQVPGEDSFGIAQWNPAVNRKQELIEYCIQNGFDYTSLFGQLKFLKYDLDNTYGYRVNKKLGDLKDASTIDQASKIFEFQYERPQKGSTQDRIDKARKVFERLA